MDSTYEFILSPPDQKTLDYGIVKFPTFNQISKCGKARQFGQLPNTKIYDSEDGIYGFNFPDFMDIKTQYLGVELETIGRESSSHSYQYEVTLSEYEDKISDSMFYFDVVVKNPCNDGNKIILKDSDSAYQQRVVYSFESVMVKWTTRTYFLNDIFIDEYTSGSQDGGCGELVFEFEDLDTAPYLQYDKEQ